MDKKALTTFALLILTSLIVHQSYFSIENVNSEMLKFKEWAAQYGKIYQSQSEMNYRFKVFTQTLKKITENNLDYEKGLVTHLEGLNQFSDLTFDQWKKLYLLELSPQDIDNGKCSGPQAPTDNIPETFDWTEKKAVTPAIDQGKCAAGSYAIAANGAIETLKYLATGHMTQLSAQQLIDCQAKSCTTINPQSLFQYVLDFGITSQVRYPYKQAASECIYTKTMKQFQIAQCSVVTTKSQLALRAAVRKMGVTALLDGSELKDYKSGVFTPTTFATSKHKCNSSVNYAGLIVGYGKEGSKLFWKIRISMGPNHGQSGYFRLQRSLNSKDTGACNIQTTSLFPIA